MSGDFGWPFNKGPIDYKARDVTAPPVELPPLEAYADEPAACGIQEIDILRSRMHMAEDRVDTLNRKLSQLEAENLRLRERANNQRRELRRLNAALLNQKYLRVLRELDAVSLEQVMAAMGVESVKVRRNLFDVIKDVTAGNPLV